MKAVPQRSRLWALKICAAPMFLKCVMSPSISCTSWGGIEPVSGSTILKKGPPMKTLRIPNSANRDFAIMTTPAFVAFELPRPLRRGRAAVGRRALGGPSQVLVVHRQPTWARLERVVEHGHLVLRASHEQADHL